MQNKGTLPVALTRGNFPIDDSDKMQISIPLSFLPSLSF